MSFGSTDAPTQLELFVDYLCPHCKDFAEVNTEDLKALADANEVGLQIYVRPMLDARTGTTYSLDTASCAMAAYVQDPALFWEVDEALFELQPGDDASALPSQDDIFAAAKEAGLSEESLAAVKEGKYTDIVEAAEDEGAKRKIGTPVLYINGAQFEGDFTVPGEVEKAVKEASK